MITLKSLSKKYDLDTGVFLEAYEEAVNTYKQFYEDHNKNRDLIKKYFEDNLNTLGINSEKEIDYLWDLFVQKEPSPEDTEKKRMQTSGDMSAALGMNRPHGYKTQVMEPYGR